MGGNLTPLSGGKESGNTVPLGCHYVRGIPYPPEGGTLESLAHSDTLVERVLKHLPEGEFSVIPHYMRDCLLLAKVYQT